MNGDREAAEEALAVLLADFDDALAAGRVPEDDTVTLPEAQRQSVCRELEDLRLVRELLGRPTSTATPSGLPWTHLDRFELRRELGRGATGIVYLAHDPLLHREVALKVPRPEVVLTPELRQRFRREARVSAGLDHPGIVRVFEAGEIGPLCYLVYEYCPGKTLAGWLAQQVAPVPIPRAAQIVAALADAVHYAHERGVIHRDLKPANVLMGPEPRPLPRITDFGLARLLEEAEHRSGTRSGTVLGTVAYMSPEQAAGHASQAGAASDVYALGAILYETLTGRPPFQGQSEMDTLRQIQTEEPLPPARLRPGLPRDLATICLRTLIREPAGRYASAADLSDDLKRFLAGEPIRARPVGVVEWAYLWVRRRPTWAALFLFANVTLAALLVLAVGAVYHGELRESYDQASRALAAEQEERARADALLYLLRVRVAEGAWQEGRVAETRRQLADCPEHLRAWEWHYLARLCKTGQQTLRGHSGPAVAVAASADGTRVASTGTDGTVCLWDAKTGQALLAPLPAHKMSGTCIAFTPDGRSLASGGLDRAVRIWDAVTGVPRHVMRDLPHSVLHVAFSHDGKRLAVCCREGKEGFPPVLIYDVSTGQVALRLTGVRWGLRGVAFSPRGDWVVASCGNGVIHYWDAQTGDPGPRFTHQGKAFGKVAFSPDGKLLATVCGPTALLWDVPGKGDTSAPKANPVLPRVTLTGHHNLLAAVAFSPDGKRLATASWDQTARVWDVSTGQEVFTFRGHEHQVTDVTFLPDGRLASASNDHTVKLWAGTAQNAQTVARHVSPLEALAISPDGNWLAEGSTQGLTLRNLATGQASFLGRGYCGQAVCFSSDGRWLAFGGRLKEVRVWDMQAGRLMHTLGGHLDTVNSFAFIEEGRTLISAGSDHTLRFWDVSTGRCERTDKRPSFVSRVFASSDGVHLAVIQGGKAVIHPLVNGAPVRALPQRNGVVCAVAFSPDGRLLASSSIDGTVILTDVRTGEEVFALSGHAMSVSALAWHPSGRRLVSAGTDGRVCIWDVRLGVLALAVRAHSAPIRGVLFSPDGRWLYTAGEDGLVKRWEGPSSGG